MSETYTRIQQADEQANIAAEQAAIDGKWENWAKEDPDYEGNKSLQQNVGQISVDGAFNRMNRDYDVDDAHDEALTDNYTRNEQAADKAEDLQSEFALDTFFDDQEAENMAEANKENYDPGHYDPETELR